MRRAWGSFALLFAFAACGGGADVRQEVIGKLRALGVAANPVTAAWSEGDTPNVVELTVYAALPVAQIAVTVAAYKDPRQTALLTYPEDQIMVDQSSLKITPSGALNLVEFKAKVAVPTLAQATAARAIRSGSSGGQVNYGFRIDAGSEEELVTGTFMAYAAGAPELALATPTVDIVEPAAGGVLPQHERGALKATVGNVNGEDIKLGWFVSGGEVTNRRAKETLWKHPEGAGPQTVILTIRGKKSRAFSMKVVNVSTQ
jgi:hypothetical protein